MIFESKITNRMRIYSLILFLLLSSPNIFAQQSIEGKWQTGVDNTIVETYQKDGAWFGKIVSTDNSQAKIGTDILRGFKEEDNVWKGKLYAPKKDKLVDAVITPAKDKLFIKVSSGLFSKNLEWTKAE